LGRGAAWIPREWAAAEESRRNAGGEGRWRRAERDSD